MKAREDLAGRVYGRLTVLRQAEDWVQPSGQRKAMWACRCDCGIIKKIRSSDFKSGHTSSCGCLSSELTSQRLLAHGNCIRKEGTSPLYSVWAAIKQRCFNKNNKRFRDYGARGIIMYEVWKNDFSEFKEYIEVTLGTKPKGFTLDRINNDLGYFPGNLQWASYKQQANNRRPHRKRK